MNILGLPAFKDNYIWLVINEANHSALCIDPGDAEPVLTFCYKNKLSLTHVLITHHHFDHAGGLEKLLQTNPKLTVFGPQDDRIPLINTPVRDEDVIHLDPFDFRVLSIPGHTSSHISYFEPSNRWLFCGDTLFSAGCGRVFDGTIEELHHSLQGLQALPDDTLVYCAHEYTRQNMQFALTVEPNNTALQAHANYLENNPQICSLPSTIGLEKKINPFLRLEENAVQAFAHRNGIKVTDSLAVFTCLRQKKDEF